MTQVLVNSPEDFWVNVMTQKSFVEISPTQFDTSYQVEIVIAHSTAPVVTTFASSNEAIATVSTSGLVTYVSTGDVTITATSTSNEVPIVNAFDVQMYSKLSNADDPFDYAVGSLGEEVSTATKTVLDLAIAEGRTDFNVFSTMDHSGDGTYVRNTNCWMNDWDLSGISVWNSSGGQNKAGHVSSRDTVTCAAHYSVPTGTVFRFVTTDNQVVESTVVDQRYILDYDGRYWDTQVCLLDSPLPTSIKVIKYLPATFTFKFPFLVAGNYLQLAESVFMNQDRRAVIRAGQFNKTPAPLYPDFWFQVRNGDSGSAGLLSFEGELIQGGGVSGNIQCLRDLLTQATMDMLGSAYPLEYVDISAYPNVNNHHQINHDNASNPTFPNDALVPSAYKNFG
tara:strand:+ start:1419 stop:2600 length:1182 start_codon:yes stop_codon:yes gene_type:complete